jgi:peptidoglycan/LPS O-acetylase OafA/YrhL
MTITMYDSFGTPGAPPAFLKKRLIRIVPLYWLVTLVYATKLAALGTPARFDDLAMSLAFIPYDHGQVLQGRPGPVYGLGWTLNYEMFFYCLFSLSLLFRRRSALLLLLGAFALTVTTGWAGLLRHCSGPFCAIPRYYADPIILYFAGGILLALARVWLARHHRLPTIDLRVAMAIALCSAAIYATLVISGYAPQYSPMFTNSQVVACVLSTTVCGLAATSSAHGRLSGLLLVLGDASYSIYLTHSFLIGPAGRAWALLSLPNSVTLFTVAMIVGCALLGVLVYRHVETPMLGFLKRRLTKRRLTASRSAA